MNIPTLFEEEVSSTNLLAKAIINSKEQDFPFIVQTHFQTKGKGQINKVWESNSGENLLFSLALKIKDIKIEDQFIISKIAAVSLWQVLKPMVNDISIKWPNDIYVGHHKIAGILIENTIIGPSLDSCIIGIGLNVNQITFSSAIPNPTSLKILSSSDHNIEHLKDLISNQIISNFSNQRSVEDLYIKHLYRRDELGQFKDLAGTVFLGVILGVDSIGRLQVRIENNKIKLFDNHQVEYILPHQSSF